jgi:hypothetical protein
MIMNKKQLMTEIIYKTRPKLFILLTPILGAIFFGLLFWMTLKKSNSKLDIILLPFLILFATFSLLSLIYFIINNKTILLTKENIIISYLFLPLRKTFSLTKIANISQITKSIFAMLPHDMPSNLSFIYTETITTFNFIDNKQIKLRSIGKSDFEQFNKAYRKTRNNEGKIKMNSQSKLDYIGDNIDGIMWGVLLFVLTIGLGHELLTT